MLYIEKIKYRNKIKYIGFISRSYLGKAESIWAAVSNYNNLSQFGVVPCDYKLRFKDCVFDNRNDLLTKVSAIKTVLSKYEINRYELDDNYKRLCVKVKCRSIIRNGQIYHYTTAKILDKYINIANKMVYNYIPSQNKHYRSVISKIRKRYPYIKIILTQYNPGQLVPITRNIK
ncbi:MAG: hypothetical protein BAJALOKI3v1_50041 [Promethearchaeota archaeon]|nr:MAG: hypothetical protein BAJALOKI3v1_50041 [Candidatus Lokiarchaeota archaeon]